MVGPLMKTKAPTRKASDSDYEPEPSKKSKMAKNPSKPKAPKPTEDQKNRLFEFMEAHKDYAQGRVRGKNAVKLLAKLEAKLERAVNAGEGVPRSGKKWWKAWVSMRNNGKGYAAKNYQTKDNRTGGGGPPEDSLLESDISLNDDDKYFTDCKQTNAIMRIIGWHSALGISGVVDDLDDTRNRDEEEEGDNEHVSLSTNPTDSHTETISSNEIMSSTELPSSIEISSLNKPPSNSQPNSNDNNESNSKPKKKETFVTSTPAKTVQQISQPTNQLQLMFEELQPSDTSIPEKLDMVLVKFNENNNLLRSLLEHFKANSMLVLTSPAEAPSTVITVGESTDSVQIPQVDTPVEPFTVFTVGESTDNVQIPQVDTPVEPFTVITVGESTDNVQIPQVDTPVETSEEEFGPQAEPSEETSPSLLNKSTVDSLSEFLDNIFPNKNLDMPSLE